MTEIFGTDGIRGEVNTPPLTPGNVVRIAQALCKFWRSIQNHEQNTIVLGNDGRHSAKLLTDALSAGILGSGFSVKNLGLCSTPALSYSCRETDCTGGIMISASHNPFYDNGLKPFLSSGEKFTPQQEKKVEKFLESKNFSRVKREKIGEYENSPDCLTAYRNALSTRNIDYTGHVVIDCANGGMSDLAPNIVSNYVNELSVISNEPTGYNINKNCGSLHSDKLANTVLKKEADVGFAFDGDGDRLIGISENGEMINGDIFLYMLAVHTKQPGIVFTTMSNFGLRKALRNNDIDYSIVDVGDWNVYTGLMENGEQIGGEQSGHIIDQNWLPTGDGLHTLLCILEVLSESEKTLGEWADEVEIYPQVLKNIEVTQKPPLETLEVTPRKIEQMDEKLGQDGRVFVRYSGTEPVARIMLEGHDETKLENYADEICTVMDNEINSERVTSS